ncbi:hypothetical protein CW749_15720 [Vibrio sp. vnigr-6D03]|uniref:HAD-IA family hydrolase n=1 Tax=Vibrio sp. vnigr-6D03 TaxID=2058088 RepID=UPI000C327AC0|nr:HAD-IA family hydrolase [Vibrio sp. vnigr-6D03]PKF78523.1 hypothetical protein CW749_15720 [Vibrio sp. vnigr-6D03]
MDALIFDCDGVLVDTECDGHRVAFNQAFQEKGLLDYWSKSQYEDLLGIAGGKERMSHYFNAVGWPEVSISRDEFIKNLHQLKTAIFMALIESGELAPRPGVKTLITEAYERGIPLAVCSTSNEKAVKTVVKNCVGEEIAKSIRVFAGDVVSAKKPDPAVYRLAAEKMQLSPKRCLVVEDSNIGMRAALGAGMNCLVTKSYYTENEDFSGANRVVSDLSEVDLNLCYQLVGDE